MVSDLPQDFIIPILVVMMDMNMVPIQQIRTSGRWPDFRCIVNTTDRDIKDHPWFRLQEAQKQGKGKGRATVSDKNMEALGSARGMTVGKDYMAESGEQTSDFQSYPWLSPCPAHYSATSASDMSPTCGHGHSHSCTCHTWK